MRYRPKRQFEHPGLFWAETPDVSRRPFSQSLRTPLEKLLKALSF
jgi:hypothetical protein